MTSRTNLRQQLLKEQPMSPEQQQQLQQLLRQQPQQQGLSLSLSTQQPVTTSAIQNLIITRASAAPMPIVASSLHNGGQASWSQQQQQQQQQHSRSLEPFSSSNVFRIVKQSPQEETSPLSPNSTASVSEAPNAMEEVDIDFIDPTFDQLSSTVPTHSGQLAGFGTPSADEAASNSSFGFGGGNIGGVSGGGGGGGFKPSTSAPASTQIFLAMNQLGGGAAGGAAVGFSIGGSSGSGGVGSQLADEDKSAALRDRYKKESHNRIERKRRENINYQISELGECIPRSWFRESELKKNKGNILKASVEYIKEMQATNVQLRERLDSCSQREVKLEQLYKALVARIQDMERTMRDSGVQYRANSFDEDIIRELIGFLADSGASASALSASGAPAPAPAVSNAPTVVVKTESDVGSLGHGDVDDDDASCVTMNDLDPMLSGCDAAGSPFFVDNS